MLGMEIKLNQKRIEENEEYSYEDYIYTLDELFKKYGLDAFDEEGARRYLGHNESDDFCNIAILFSKLNRTRWFMQNLEYWYYLRSDDDKEPYEFIYEDNIEVLRKNNMLFWLDPKEVKPKKGIIAYS